MPAKSPLSATNVPMYSCVCVCVFVCAVIGGSFFASQQTSCSENYAGDTITREEKTGTHGTQVTTTMVMMLIIIIMQVYGTARRAH